MHDKRLRARRLHVWPIWGLTAWPGLKLEHLKGDRKGPMSIRINDQYRICFRFKEGQVFDVEIIDYH